MFSYAFSDLVETIGHDYPHGEEVVGRTEATGGHVAL